MLDGKHIYTVSELNSLASGFLESTFPDIWLEGEISNCKMHSSGHIYLTLKDENAQISAILYKGYAHLLRFVPEDGLKVIVRGKITLFSKRGQYQIIIYHMDPAGKGALQIAFEQLKEKLLREGLFDEARKRSLPYLPTNIGVITSQTGAAIKDFISVINRRFANIEILIYPVHVQGEKAAPEIVEAIEQMNEQFPCLDVLIITRGGGSIEDLWAFNEEAVARAIYNSRIPVISAVGHEVDFTISDFVADMRAPTPSAAAELVVKNKQELVASVNSINNRLLNIMNNTVSLCQARLQRWTQSRVFQRPLEIVYQLQQELDNLIDRMGQYIIHSVQINRKSLLVLSEKLQALSPMAVLCRGYSIAYKLPAGSIIKSSDEVVPNDMVRLQLFRGDITCEVKHTSSKK